MDSLGKQPADFGVPLGWSGIRKVKPVMQNALYLQSEPVSMRWLYNGC